jgi:EAL domain-containing protein (putative c-di-GMP-specific phosphodiesterase class I)
MRAAARARRGIALDDFGSGFSGFSYLKALDVDLLKIDGQFVKELASNRVDRLVVEAILHVANGMGLPTVAEYVTDEAVAEQLRELGATYGQGFHLGKPAPLEPQRARSAPGAWRPPAATSSAAGARR